MFDVCKQTGFTKTFSVSDALKTKSLTTEQKGDIKEGGRGVGDNERAIRRRRRENKIGKQKTNIIHLNGNK